MLEQSFGKGRVPREDRSLTQGSSDFRKALAGTSRFFLWIWGGGAGGWGACLGVKRPDHRSLPDSGPLPAGLLMPAANSESSQGKISNL